MRRDTGILTRELRTFLTDRLSHDEFMALCFDYYPPVYREFAPEMTRSRRVDLLLRWGVDYDKLRHLADALQTEFPDRYVLYLAPAIQESRLTSETRPPTGRSERNPRQVFIGHAMNPDRAFSQRLASDLEGHGWAVWIAPNSILPGEKWMPAIDRGLRESGVFLLLLTQAAVNSEWVRDETYDAIQLARQDKMLFVPLRDEAEVITDIPPSWNRFQYISFSQTAYEEGFLALMTRLEPEKMRVLATEYAQFEQAVSAQDWSQAARLGERISTAYPHYRDVDAVMGRIDREQRSDGRDSDGDDVKTAGVPAWAWAGGAVALIAIVLWMATQLPRIVASMSPAEVPAETAPEVPDTIASGATAAATDSDQQASEPTGPSAATNAIGLGQTVTGEVAGDGTDVWTFYGSPETVDVVLAAEQPHDGLLFLVLPPEPPAEAEPLAYVDWLGKGQGQLLRFFNIDNGYRILVEDVENDGAPYSLTIAPSEFGQISPGVAQSGSVVGANPDIFLFEAGPMRFDFTLEMAEPGQPLLQIFDSGSNRLEYIDTTDEERRIRLSGYFLDERPFQFVIQDSSNRGADYTFLLTPIACDERGCVGDGRVREIDNMPMAYVPAGSFMMGSESGFEDERPPHAVTLDGFWIDEFEVTHAQYAAFLTELGNQTEAGETWFDLNDSDAQIVETPDGYQPDSRFREHPVVEVTWFGARAYCEWVGGRLPSEAEWEYAARGPQNFVYPWGNDFDGTKLNFCDVNCEADWKDESIDDGFARTAPVGTYPAGQSWVLAKDLAGNVWEWVNDWYEPRYSPDASHTKGPDSGSTKVLRGGSWVVGMEGVRTANRNADEPTYSSGDNGIGFRCAG